MKKIHFLFVAILLISLSCKKEKDNTDNLALGNLSISPSKLVGGESATINYLGNDSITESIYYYLVKNRAYPLDVNFSAEKKATISIPDSAQAIAFQLKKGETFDNNNKQGYLIPLKDASGAGIPGSKASLAYFSLTYGKNQGIDKNADSLLLDIKNDIDKHPKLKNHWYFTYLTIYKRINKVLDKDDATAYANNLTSKTNAPEEDYNNAIAIYNMLNEKGIADSLNKVAVAKYPNGKLVKNKYASEFLQEQDLNRKLQLFKDNKQYFNKQLKEYALSTFAKTHAKNKDYDAFFKCTDSISDKSLLASTYNNLAWDLVQKDKDLDFASSISKSSLDLIQSSEKPNYLTQNQHKKSIRSNYVMYADTYAWILFKQGNIKEAIKYQEDITSNMEIGKKDPYNLKQKLIEFLIADNQFKKAQSKAELFVKNGSANSNMMPFFKQAYIKNQGSIDGFETLFSSLEKESKKIILKEIKKQMLDEVAPDFKLKNLEGTEIALSDLKDKVVILDFWATWCGPCIASFPAMQTAVNKYKDNPNVVFLFIDTRESGTPEEMQKNALAFIAKNKYSFNVLLDTKKDKDSNDFSTVNNYNVNGIPTKIIVGTDGKIKFKSIGYSGNADGLVQELEVMIEAAQS